MKSVISSITLVKRSRTLVLYQEQTFFSGLIRYDKISIGTRSIRYWSCLPLNAIQFWSIFFDFRLSFRGPIVQTAQFRTKLPSPYINPLLLLVICRVGGNKFNRLSLQKTKRPALVRSKHMFELNSWFLFRKFFLIKFVHGACFTHSHTHPP